MHNDIKLSEDFPRERSVWSRVAMTFVTAFILVAMVWYLYHNQAAWRSLGRAGTLDIVYLILIWLVAQSTAGYINYMIFLELGTKLTFIEWFGLPLYQAVCNYVVPLRGGAAVTAIYLKKRHGMAYSRFLSCFMTVHVLFMLTTGPVACLLLIVLVLTGGDWHGGLFGFFAVVTVAMWVCWLILPKLRFSGGRIGKILLNVSQGWQAVSGNSRLIFKLIILICVSIIAHAVRIYIAMRAVGLSSGILESGICGIILQYSVLVKVLPGNFGVQEGTLSLSLSILGYPAEMGMAAALLIRGVGLTTKISTGVVFACIFNHRLAKTNTNHLINKSNNSGE